MKNCLRIAISTALALGVCAPLAAETVPLFDATPITDSGYGANINDRRVYDSNSITVYCDGSGTATVQTVGGSNPIVDNYMTAGDDLASICSGGNPNFNSNPPVISGTNCFTSGSSNSAYWGEAIETVFTSNATAAIDLADGQNDLTVKLWDWGGVYGNTALELVLPANCSTTMYTTLCAGQHMPVGDVGVTNDGEYLYVSFEITEPGWYLEETHVAVGDIPQTKQGNPIPGKFPFACELDGSLQTACTVTIPLGELAGSVEIATHAAVFELAGDGCRTDTQYASEIVLAEQGPLKNGGMVLDARSAPEAVFDPDDGAPGADYSFYSLGFGGALTVGFGHPVFNAPGIDVCFQEVTNGRSAYPEETAEVSALLVGLDEEPVAAISNRDNGTGLSCVDLPEYMMMADHVKAVDTTDPSIHAATADGYDIDWIGACYLYLGDETAWGAACPDDGGTSFDGSNWATYFTYDIK